MVVRSKLSTATYKDSEIMKEVTVHTTLTEKEKRLDCERFSKFSYSKRLITELYIPELSQSDVNS